MRLAIVFLSLILAGCASADPPKERAIGTPVISTDTAFPIPKGAVTQEGVITPADYEAVMAPNAPDELREAFINRLPQVVIDDDGTPRSLVLWEGDQLLTRREVRTLLMAGDTVETDPELEEIIVMTDGQGDASYWPVGNRQLTYWVHAASFRSQMEYDFTRKALARAAKDWEEVCPGCQLTIREVSTPNLATFKVQFLRGDNSFLAAAFFPNDPPWRRFLYVGAGYFTTTFNQTGIMRHELGHVLGYRHEHIVGIPGCYREDNRWMPLTNYDPQSAMHYFCGGGGTRDLKLSINDKLGHRSLYGWRQRRRQR